MTEQTRTQKLFICEMQCD